MRRLFVVVWVMAGCAKGEAASPDALPGEVPDAVDDPDDPDAEPEVPVEDCDNDMEDDFDGWIDCDDPDCVGDPACAGEVTDEEEACSDGYDNDGDGPVDCADPTCAWACTALAATCAGNQIRVHSSAGQSVNIPDGDSVTRSVTVAPAGTIVDVAVRIDLDHTYTADLDISLRSPATTQLVLSSDNGDGGDYANTVFHDGAATAITAGDSPFAGTFRPEDALAGLDGESITGTWDVRIVDDYVFDDGLWYRLDLGFCVTP